jgi:hypothetical protein
MSKRRKHKPVGSPLKAVAERETERFNDLLAAIRYPTRLAVDEVLNLFNAAKWTCQDTKRLYNVDDPLLLVWFDNPLHCGLVDNLAVVAASQEINYLSWDVLHKYSWAASRAA